MMGRLLANIISGMFHPLLMLTYGTILALTFTYLSVYPIKIKLYLTGFTFLSTAMIPGLLIFFMVKSGKASGMDLDNRHERLLPYLIFFMSVSVCIFYLYKMMLPFWFLSLFMGCAASLILTLLINRFWKISAHLLGIGGLLGGAMGTALTLRINPYAGFIWLFLIAGGLASARLFLSKHTPMQVYAGFCLGFICTFVASFFSYLFLFI